MSIKSIIIDNKQTTAKRVSSDKVQLNLVAIPLDEQNDAEPNLNLRLYINGQLFQNLQSGPDWRVNESVVIDSTDTEQITIEIEEVVQWVRSKIKCVMIGEIVEDNIQTQEKKESLWINLYNLHKKILTPFAAIDSYFQKIIKTKNNFDIDFIDQEFKKIWNLAKLKYKLENLDKSDLISLYKQEFKKMKASLKS